jgi:hypothetical protein
MALLLIAFSCSESPSVNKEITVYDKFLASNSFKDLGINAVLLDLAKAAQAPKDSTGIIVMIPYINNDLKLVVGYGKKVAYDSYDFKTSWLTKYNTNQSFEALSKSIKEGTFSGSIDYAASNGDTYRYSFTKGNIAIDTREARIQGCDGLEGAVNCAAWRIHDQNWWDRGWCYVDMPWCLIQTTISCAIDGCKGYR